MLNTQFSVLKKKALRRSGNHYNAGDSELLEIAGEIINDVLGIMQVEFSGSPYVTVIGKSQNTVADQTYIQPTETDILEILQVYQKVTDTKLIQYKRTDYVMIMPDPSELTGVPELGWFPEQIVTAGQSIFKIHLIPTPSAVQAVFYDYIKTLRFSVDGTGADSEYCALPNIYDEWIYSEFNLKFIKIIDPSNDRRYAIAERDAEKTAKKFKDQLTTKVGRVMQPYMYGETVNLINKLVQDTPDPR